MTSERLKLLNGPIDFTLTDDEIKEGWHFCFEFDGLCCNSNTDPDPFPCGCNEYQKGWKTKPKQTSLP